MQRFLALTEEMSSAVEGICGASHCSCGHDSSEGVHYVVVGCLYQDKGTRVRRIVLASSLGGGGFCDLQMVLTLKIQIILIRN